MCYDGAIRRHEQPAPQEVGHTCATLMIKQSIRPRIVIEILGHSQIATTMKTYSPVLPEVQRDAVNVLDTLFTEMPDAEGEQPVTVATSTSPDRDNTAVVREVTDLLGALADDVAGN